MIPTNDLRMLAKYKVIRTVRPSDGATLIATRKVKDEKLPVFWDVEVTSPQQIFSAPVRSWTEPPSTSKLLKDAREAEFGDWYPIPEDAEPDPKDYLVD